MHNRLRIGFVTTHSACDQRAYSGTAFSMREAFRRNSEVELFDIDGLATSLYPVWRGKQAAYWYGLGKRYWMNRQPAVLDGYAAQVSRRLSAIGSVDVLLSPGSIPLSHYDGHVPVVFWSDATFNLLADFYPEATGLCGETLRNGHRQERGALGRATLAIYSSDWAAASAQSDYAADPAKVVVVPYGANVAAVPRDDEIHGLATARLAAPLRLLFVGSKWLRKGGDIAVGATEALRMRGCDVRLDILGCDPPKALSETAIVHGFLSKDDGTQRERIAELFRRSTVLVLPTRADCVPMVIAEAYAYGLPVVTTNVGGIATVVDDRVTGRLVSPSADSGEWANAIVDVVTDRSNYSAMSIRARQRYSTELNWAMAVQRVVSLLRSRCLLNRAA